MNNLGPGIALYNFQLEDMDRLIPDINYSVETNVVELENGVLVIPFPDPTVVLDDFAPSKDLLLHGLGTTLFEAFKGPMEEYLNFYDVETTNWDAYGIWKFGEQIEPSNLIDDSPQWHRRVSVIYFLNDGYEGGDMFFPNFGVSYKPAKGDLLIFPSGYMYKHINQPVTSGYQYCVKQWAR